MSKKGFAPEQVINKLREVEVLVSRQENPADRRMHEPRVTEKGENKLTGLREESIKSLSEVLDQHE